MQMEKSGVYVLDMADFGPYLLWLADLFRCPKCKAGVVAGFADRPCFRHEDGQTFTETIDAARNRGELFASRLYIEETVKEAP